MQTDQLLLFVGTYGEKLGHVPNGHGEGVYVRQLRGLSLVPPEKFFGRGQLGGAGGLVRNATYLAAHRDESTSELHLYICDESS